MRDNAPFQPEDLDELDALYQQATAVVPMREIADGNDDPGVIGLRHDVDNELDSAVWMAEWEAERGYRSTYFLLHTERYWRDTDALLDALEVFRRCGHEVGLHVNAITEAIHTGRNPVLIAAGAALKLRLAGFAARGVVAHGDPACYQHHFVNDEIFTESARPSYGPPDREIAGVRLRPVSRRELGFDYDPNWLTRGTYLSDSGGHWSTPFEEITNGYSGQLHMLVHPCWWREALRPVGVMTHGR